MTGRGYLITAWIAGVCLVGAGRGVSDVLPTGPTRPAIELAHFPSRQHAFVWRNWEMVSLERMAEVLEASPEKVRRLGESMGLPPHRRPPAEYQQRGYISIIRRNWHLLPYEQLLRLLDWDATKLAFTLREDDFLWIKLGSLKPSCPPLRYTEPDSAARQRCNEIKTVVSSCFAGEPAGPSRARFDFFRDTTAAAGRDAPSARSQSPQEKIRFLYSYCGVFGDPLLEPRLDPYPNELLLRLSALGVNGVWLHVVLHQLAPSRIFSEFGKDHERRLTNLRRLVQRARQYGIEVFLYMNEPRAMEASFFEGREDLQGVAEGDYRALCTSAPQVRQWLSESLTYVFKQVPGLGGVFTITASENLTNCYSHSRTPGCPRCSARTGPAVIAEVNRTIAAGVRAGNPEAKVIVWDWGWPDGTDAGWGGPDWVPQIIKTLPDDVYLMSVSEWGKRIERGGVAGRIGEYSISAVGPGPRATRHWALADARGLKTIAKVQVNCTWELSAVPYLPVMNLVAQHCRNLAEKDVDGLMLSWSVGGYPSPNLQLAREFASEPTPTVDAALATVAKTRYGPEAAEHALAAWSRFSGAFAEYPFHAGFVYRGPIQYGPANLLYPEPTGYSSTMIGFPYDDVDGWRATYPPEVLAGQFEKIAAGWAEGLTAFRSALDKAGTPSQQAAVREDLAIAEAAGLHFRSVANQIRFIMARNALLSDSLGESAREAHAATVRKIAVDEIDSARRLFVLTREDPRIGFEASNHYYYLPLDLVEKAINCQYILSTWLAGVTRKGNGHEHP